MKKQYFDRFLFREGMRQLRLPCYLMMFFLGLTNILLPVGEVITHHGLMLGSYAGTGSRIRVDLLQMNPFAYFLVVLAPFLVIRIFDFTTRRNSSDFYHAIPQTRICLYNSYLAAVLAWCLLLQWISCVFSLAIHMFLSSYYEVELIRVLIQNIILMMTLVLTAGGAAFAVALTGTILTNMAVTGILLFAPRLIMLVIQQIVGESLTVVSGDNYLEFLGNGWNVLTSVLYGVFVGSNMDILVSWKAGFYTLFLGLFYIAAGMFFFHRRRSEKAGQAACSSGLQLAFRLCPAYLFCLIPNIMVFWFLADRNSDIGMVDIYEMFIFYLIGVLLYFLYELITTRRWKNLVKVIPGLGILLMLNLFTIFGMFGMQRQVLSFVPDASEIESICLDSAGRSVGRWENDRLVYYRGYLTQKSGEVELRDPELLQLVADRLKDTVNYDLKNGSHNSVVTDGYKTVQFNMKNHRTYVRNISVTNSDIYMMTDLLKKSEEYQKVYMELPAAEDPSVTAFAQEGLTEEQARVAYAALLEDVKDMGFTDWYRYCTSYVDYRTYYTSLEMTYRINQVGYASTFPITELTPKAAQVYIDSVWENDTENRDQIIADLKQLLKLERKYEGQIETQWDSFSYNYYEQMPEGNCQVTYGELQGMSQPENLSVLIRAMEEQRGASAPNINGDYLDLWIGMEYSLPEEAEEIALVSDRSMYYENSDGTINYSYDTHCYLNLSALKPETREAIINICGERNIYA